MYVKIVRRWEEGEVSNQCPVSEFPKRNTVFETKELEYWKENMTGDWWQNPITLVGEQPAIGEEMIVIRFLAPECKVIVATNCTMFLMGADGKTIDSLSC